MSELRILPIKSLGHGFVEPPYLPEGRDEYYLRNEQSHLPIDEYRQLRADEIETLVKNGNAADNWDNILVTDHFIAHQIKNCEFYGLVRIGRLEEVVLEYHDLTVPVGITNSRIIACDIGDDVAIHDVRYLAHYIIGSNTILMNLDEMHTTNHAKFGNGIIKDGEDEDVRVWLELINEAGGRCVMPFDGMTPGDAYLWTKYPDDKQLVNRLGEITQNMFDSRRGFYGTVGQRCVIKNSRIIKDVKIGDCCYIKGANKLKNLSINSTEDEPTQIGEGVEMVNGILSPGCHVFYGCKAVRFYMGPNSNLKYGARLIHSYLADNSTVSCCEILNNLIFPAHEQHHNNSFLIASLVMGQSNIAACATIGSNHNSRAPDGEIHAGRGFWPGLCVSIKHNCRFASFVLLAKGDYPAEMDIRLPFCLVNNNSTDNRLEVMPAYWWSYNMYALARNTWKFNTRDKRKVKIQNIEFDSLAPDTAEEIFTARRLLQEWTARAHLGQQGESPDQKSADELAGLGTELLDGPAEQIDGLEILGQGVEKTRRQVVILKAQQGYQAYRDMLHYYAVKNLIEYMKANTEVNLASMCQALAGGERHTQWVNLGGQLIMSHDLEALKADIKSGKLNNWNDIHQAYDRLWEKYPLDKQRHAFDQALDRAVEIQRYIAEATYQSRKKDFDSPFRQMSYDTTAEMEAVLGTAEGVSFVKQIRQETEAFAQTVEDLKKRG
ncbi:MAG: DUF4954 family protein [Planctomycetota bacterium]|jgi:hypothetical protein